MDIIGTMLVMLPGVVEDIILQLCSEIASSLWGDLR